MIDWHLVTLKVTSNSLLILLRSDYWQYLSCSFVSSLVSVYSSSVRSSRHSSKSLICWTSLPSWSWTFLRSIWSSKPLIVTHSSKLYFKTLASYCELKEEIQLHSLKQFSEFGNVCSNCTPICNNWNYGTYVSNNVFSPLTSTNVLTPRYSRPILFEVNSWPMNNLWFILSVSSSVILIKSIFTSRKQRVFWQFIDFIYIDNICCDFSAAAT